MKAILTILSFLFTLYNVSAQFPNPVKWSFDQEQISDEETLLRFNAKIDKGWHLYSQFIEDGGPIPTTFYFDDNNKVELIGKVSEEGELEEKFDPNFEMKLKWFSNEVIFTQKVKAKAGTKITGELEFMVCDDEQCLPPDLIPFEFSIAQQKEETVTTIPLPTTIEIDDAQPVLNLPAKWEYRVAAQPNNHYELQLRASIDEGWHLYATDIPEGGPIPTSFEFEETEDIQLIGTIKERGEKITEHSALFEMDLSWFEEEVTFLQKLSVKDPSKPIKGAYEFMLCDDEQCLPPEYSAFELNLDNNTWTAVPTTIELPPDLVKQAGELGFSWESYGESNCAGEVKEDLKKGSWMIFLLGFGGGLLALLTPCVFPMIPLTVSFFTKGGKEKAKGIKNAALYGLSIVIIYVALGLFITGLLGADALNAMSTNPIFNVAFFLIFVFFAFSFFGFYEIQLPSSFSNKADSLSHKGGLIGIFFMAFTLALVSFSCTGPIIGTLLVEAATGGGKAILGGHIPIKPLLGMLGFSMALALPFTLFAAFPSLLKSLPQSGGWLNTTKVVLGFLELALAFKFLSVADMTAHWGLLRIEPFLIIWMIIFLLLGLYMFKIIQFPHDNKSNKNIPIGRVVLGLASLLFVVYLGFGLNYQPRKALSGLAPPVHYNFFAQEKECPAGLKCFKDLDEGLAYAKEQDMPILLDFTGYGCVNCRKMEENVWTEKKINNLLQEFVLISLYVDDKAQLPEAEQYYSNASGRNKKIKTVGNKWHDFQIKNFGKASQPYYVLVSPDLEILNVPVAYTPDKTAYEEFLACGLNNFKEVCPSCFAMK